MTGFMASIEQVSENDLKEIQKIIGEEFPYTRKLLEPIEQRIRKQNYFLFKLQENGKILGFTELRAKDGMGELLGIAVRKEFRRKGHGRKLLRHAIGFFEKQNCFAVKLLVKKNNAPAIKLYIGEGFRTIRTIDLRHEKAEAFEMMLDL